MAHEQIISQLSLLSHFYLCESVFGIRTGTGIRIHKVAEYESNWDPDPQH